MATVTRDPVIFGSDSLFDTRRARLLAMAKGNENYLSVVEVKESADLSHDIEGIAFNLHSSHHDHFLGDPHGVVFRHLGRRRQRIGVYQS